MATEDLHLDLQELQRLLEFTNRPSVQGILVKQIDELEAKIALHKSSEADKQNAGGEGTENGTTKSSNVGLPVSKIRTYGWDQSEKFVKLYITLEGIHKLPKENISVEYSKTSFKLFVRNLGNKNVELIINNLADTINASSSSHKVKANEIVLLLRKANQGNWSGLTKEKPKAEDKTPKFDANEDPSTGIMNMMRKMYEEGDDDMKRTIAKAWTEGREKSAAGGGMDF